MTWVSLWSWTLLMTSLANHEMRIGYIYKLIGIWFSFVASKHVTKRTVKCVTQECLWIELILKMGFLNYELAVVAGFGYNLFLNQALHN